MTQDEIIGMANLFDGTLSESKDNSNEIEKVEKNKINSNMLRKDPKTFQKLVSDFEPKLKNPVLNYSIKHTNLFEEFNGSSSEPNLGLKKESSQSNPISKLPTYKDLQEKIRKEAKVEKKQLRLSEVILPKSEMGSPEIRDEFAKYAVNIGEWYKQENNITKKETEQEINVPIQNYDDSFKIEPIEPMEIPNRMNNPKKKVTMEENNYEENEETTYSYEKKRPIMRRPFFEQNIEHKDDTQEDNQEDTQIDLAPQDRYLKFKMLEQEYPIQYQNQMPYSIYDPVMMAPIQNQDPRFSPYYAPNPQYMYPRYPSYPVNPNSYINPYANPNSPMIKNQRYFEQKEKSLEEESVRYKKLIEEKGKEFLYNLRNIKDPAKSDVIKTLLDGEWHSEKELIRIAKKTRYMGQVAFGMMMLSFEELVDTGFIQKEVINENGESEYKINDDFVGLARAAYYNYSDYESKIF